MARLATVGILTLLAVALLVQPGEARRSAAKRRAAKQSKATSTAARQYKAAATAQAFRKVTKGAGALSPFPDGNPLHADDMMNYKDGAPSNMDLKKSTPELMHKFAWALPKSLSGELVEKMWRLGYDPEFPSHGPQGKLYGGGFNMAAPKAAAKTEEKEPQKKTSLLQKGASRRVDVERHDQVKVKARSLAEKVVEATPDQLEDVADAMAEFVHEEVARANGEKSTKLEDYMNIKDSVNALMAKAQRTMVREGNLKIVQ
jgi:hypothetical protein